MLFTVNTYFQSFFYKVLPQYLFLVKTQLYSYFHSEVYSERLQTKIQTKGTYAD